MLVRLSPSSGILVMLYFLGKKFIYHHCSPTILDMSVSACDLFSGIILCGTGIFYAYHYHQSLCLVPALLVSKNYVWFLVSFSKYGMPATPSIYVLPSSIPLLILHILFFMYHTRGCPHVRYWMSPN